MSSIKDGVLSLRHMDMSQRIISATPRHVFSDAHAYNINSTSINSDGETFLSSDDLRINIWSQEVTNTCFSKWSDMLLYVHMIHMALILNINLPPPPISSFLLIRYCGYKTIQYGGVDRSHHFGHISPHPLPHDDVQHLQRGHQDVRHEDLCVMWSRL